MCLPAQVAAQGGPGGTGGVYDLAACIRRAVEVYPEVKAAQAELEAALAQQSRADAARFLPSFDLTFSAGPSPEARGDALSGDTDLSSLSVFTRTEAKLVQPLYTFGKLSAAREAAAGGVDAREAGVRASQLDLEEKVATVYYGLLLADALRLLADEAMEEIGKAHDSIEAKLEEDTGEYTYTDLFKIRRFRYDVEENRNRVVKEQALSRSALKLLMGLPDRDTLRLAESELAPVVYRLASLESYQEQISRRPDLRQLEAGIRASEAAIRVERSDYFPQLFLGGGLTFAQAPNRDDPQSPFAYDPFNTFYGGAVLGFRQSLAFGQTSARVRKATADHRRLSFLGALARSAAAVDVERKYRNVVEAAANVKAADTAVSATRLWFISARDGFTAGIEEAGELIEAVKEYGVIRAKYHGEVFNLNRAWVGLVRTTGGSLLEP